MAHAAKKRKIAEEKRSFNADWCQFFFVERKGKPLCVICQETIAVCKEFNVKRHFTTNHAKFVDMPEDKRKTEFTRLAANLDRQNALFKKPVNLAQSAAIRNTRASYRVAHLVATQLKPFTDGAFVKECMMAAVEEVCPEKKDLFTNISLSASTITRRIEEMAIDIRSTLKQRCHSARFFSIALDESTDVKDTAQLAIFFRGVTDTFDVVEEFVRLMPMQGTTTGADILQCVLKLVQEFELDLSRLCAITTDGAPAMVGPTKGFASLLVKHCRDQGHMQDIMRIHCIVHQEVLCAKSTTITSVMGVVVKAVNFVLARALNHRQFRDLLSEAKAQYGDLLYYCEVRWLSRGKMLQRVFDLREELADFLDSKGAAVQEFTDPAWVQDLAFLVDLTGHLNTLNTQLQGRGVLVPDMINKIKAFETKLRLWEAQIKNRELTHFPNLATFELTNSAAQKYADALSDLRDEFANRFSELRANSMELKLFSSPFDLDADEVPANLQMELIELHCSDELKAKFGCTSPMGFWSQGIKPADFPGLVLHATKIAAMFGSTYACEQLFSRMKLTKSKTRAQLTDGHLEDALLLAVSSIKPNVELLSKDKEHQPSH